VTRRPFVQLCHVMPMPGQTISTPQHKSAGITQSSEIDAQSHREKCHAAVGIMKKLVLARSRTTRTREPGTVSSNPVLPRRLSHLRPLCSAAYRRARTHAISSRKWGLGGGQTSNTLLVFACTLLILKTHRSKPLRFPCLGQAPPVRASTAPSDGTYSGPSRRRQRHRRRSRSPP
jgi:hypothetical protein